MTMKTKISTLKELRDERKLSAVRLRSAEANLVESFNDLKEEFKPVGKVVHSVSNLFSSDHENLLSKTVGFALNGLLKKGILRNAGFITKYGLSFLATTIAKNYVSKNSGSIIDWVGSLLSKKEQDHNSNGRAYDASTVHSDRDIY
jgi:hypothetical protein